ncbi:hypothetical protein FG386_000344 [Cryptosporidium ryanae]|uniref:uncharacterized protein n=1 Tax=Cryptosporidium ryanae TaxID=515981 RepID=UPI00351A75BD|nr:hypothetical protein FG386_000344 [Cryptosporidium ryanae]
MRINLRLEENDTEELTLGEYSIDSHKIESEENDKYFEISDKDTNISLAGESREYNTEANELVPSEKMNSNDIDTINDNEFLNKVEVEHDIESVVLNETSSNTSVIDESLEKGESDSGTKTENEKEDILHENEQNNAYLSKSEEGNSDYSTQGVGDEEEHTGSITLPESTLPYKLWIDAKSRDWILEWQTKNGRWSVRKFSCKRWGKGKAYSHAMNFLASLTSCGIIKDSSGYSKQLGNGVIPDQESEVSNQSIRSVEDELVLQFLSQRDATAMGVGNSNSSITERQKGFSSGSSLNTLAAIAAAAAAAAAIASTPEKPHTRNKEHHPTGGSTINVANSVGNQTQTRGAVRKSGVPGVYWSQKPQGWRVVYYTGKDREFEYFKVPANASEEIISEILEVAKRFRSQVTAEGRHLPNGAVGSSSKRARLAERKAAAAAAAAAANARSDMSRHLNCNTNNIGDFKSGVNLTLSPPETRNNSKSMLEGDPLAQFAAKFTCPSGIPGLPTHPNPLIPGLYDWLYNPLLMNLYGNYTAASQAAAIQHWAMLQNSGNILGTGIGAADGPSNPNILNAFLQNQNSLMNPFQFQMPPVVGGSQSPNSGLMQQMPQLPSMNQAANVAAASQMGMNMFGRYYGMMLPPQTSNSVQSNPLSPVSNDVQQQPGGASASNGGSAKPKDTSNLPSPSVPYQFPVPMQTRDAAFPWLNQFSTSQKVSSDLEPTRIQQTLGEEDSVMASDTNDSTQPDDQTHISAVATQGEENENFLVASDAPNKQIETQLLEVSSGSNKTSE